MDSFAMEFDPRTREFSPCALAAPSLQAGEILIQVVCCTLCGSDLHTFSGRRAAPEHCVLGHEIIGTVAEWGPGATPRDFHGQQLRVGQRVTWTMAVGCGACFFCRNHLSQKCVSLFKYGHEPGGHESGGHEQGGQRPPTGGLSCYCVLVPGTPVFSIPDRLSDEVASPANCATATVSAAVRLIRETHSLQGSTVLIVGAGMLGLTAAARLSDAGASHIVVADPNKDRLQMSRSFGATNTIDSASGDDVSSLLASLTEGRGADIALDFAGVTAAVETCIKSVRVGGCVLLAGSVFPSDPISIEPEQVVRRMLTIRGLHNYLPNDLDDALNFLERTIDQFPFDELVTNSFPLEQAKQAFEYANEHRPVRVAVRP